LSVLQAYSGELPQALDTVKRALSSEPDHPIVWNNAGVVAFLAGDLDQAMKNFETARAHAKAHGWQDYPQAVFNLAYAKARAGDHTSADDLLRQYAQFDRGSRWIELLSEEVRLGTAVTGAARVTLGMTPQEVARVLGSSSDTEKAEGHTILHYRSRGISVVFGSEDRGAPLKVSMLLVYKPFGDSVGGITLGMPSDRVQQLLGQPLRSLGTGWHVYAPRAGFNVRMASTPDDPSHLVVVAIAIVAWV